MNGANEAEDDNVDTDEHSCSSSIGQEDDLDEDCALAVSGVGIHNGKLVVTPTQVKITFKPEKQDDS